LKVVRRGSAGSATETPNEYSPLYTSVVPTFREDFALIGAHKGENMGIFRSALTAGLRIVSQPAMLARHIIAPVRQIKKYGCHRNLLM
jgi:acyl CoA:acetate/3-ketoacid CoA transferase alpha subunit